MNIGKLLSLGALIPFGFVDAFVLVGNPRRLQTSLHIGKRVDITDAIKTSSTTSNKKYGVANYKMLLWANGYASEIIEEIEYYVEDDKVVLKKGDFQNSTAVFIDEYEEMLNEFRPLLEKEELKTQKMKSLAREIKVSE